MHALDGVLADHRAWAGQLNPPQGSRAGRSGVGGDLDTRGDRAAQEFTFGRHHVDADRRPEVDHDRRGVVLLKSCQTVDDPVGTDFFGIVDEQRYAGADAGLDEDMWNRRPVLLEHHPDLMQHRRHGGQR